MGRGLWEASVGQVWGVQEALEDGGPPWTTGLISLAERERRHLAGKCPETGTVRPGCVSHPRGPACVSALLVFILMVLI